MPATLGRLKIGAARLKTGTAIPLGTRPVAEGLSRKSVDGHPPRQLQPGTPGRETLPDRHQALIPGPPLPRAGHGAAHPPSARADYSLSRSRVTTSVRSGGTPALPDLRKTLAPYLGSDQGGTI